MDDVVLDYGPSYVIDTDSLEEAAAGFVGPNWQAVDVIPDSQLLGKFDLPSPLLLVGLGLVAWWFLRKKR